ncbi:MAG: hypothetical protein JO273_07245 [Methylobacteriaceae bacterium]|nr:hypothetical protein [Methylobacteriaceae bacterium]
MRFRLLTPPAVEPVATSDLMAFARVDVDPGDGVLQRLIVAARERVERDTGLALITQTWLAVLDRWPATPAPDYHYRLTQADIGLASGWWDGVRDGPVTLLSPSGVIEITRRPFRSLVSFQTRDITTALQSVDPATYMLEVSNDIGRIMRKPGAVWPLVVAGMMDAIEITVTLGFGDAASAVPADLQTAILMLAAHWHETREPVIDGRFGPAPEHVRAILASWQGKRLR